MSRKDLDSVYANAKVVNFDQNDKIVLISDVHRGDGTYSDSFVHNRNIYIAALKYYLKNDYVYIEVGDGDELWAGDYQSDERAGVARLSWRVSGR